MIRPSKHEDVPAMAGAVRDADRKELLLLAGQTPMEALTVGFIHSAECITGIGKGGKLVLMAGVVPTDVKGFSSVWMVSTPALTENKRELVVEGKRWLKRMRRKHGVLANVVTAQNTVHVDLIRHFGFKIGNEIQRAGLHNVPALPFKMR